MAKVKQQFNPKLWWSILRQTFVSFFQEKNAIHCAALSYYTVLTLVPILYLCFVTFGKIIGQQTMVNIISGFLTEHVGIEDVNGIISFLDTVDFEHGSVLMELIGLLALLFSASALFNAMRSGINEYMDIEKKFKNRKTMIIATVRSRLASIFLLTFFGLVVITTYFAQTVLIGFGDRWLSDFEGFSWLMGQTVQHGAAIVSNVIIFLFIFKYLHDGKVAWRVALTGSLFTSILIYVGQLLIKFYVGHFFFARDGGLAGSILVLLVWMYYSAHMIFLGAKFTSVYGKETGRPVKIA